MARSIDDTLSEAAATGVIPGVVAMAATDRGLLYQGSFGLRDMTQPQPMTSDTVFRIASLSKAVTSVAALQLVERGKLVLDAPLAPIMPALGMVSVLEGFDADGTPHLRAPRRPITLHHLLTHTAGFGYDMWNEEILQFQERTGHPPGRTGRKASLMSPLLFDPGERWNYSIATDWLGQLIEAVTQRPLEDALQEQVLCPLGMRDTSFAPGPEQMSRLARLHRRRTDGTLEPFPPANGQPAPEFHRGGGALFSTAPDYLVFLRMLLAGGTLDGVRILGTESMDLLTKNQIGDLPAGVMRSVMPELSGDVDFFPGMDLRWSHALLINMQDVPDRRRAGSLAWAGLSNSYFWIDPASRVTGVIMMQFYPFADPAAVALLGEFERGVYKAAAKAS
jgi:methyl acetate hydrolase